jgi:hypothetical protein
LNPAPLPIQFSGGVDLTTDEKQVPVTKLLNLENCVFTKATTLSKRNGYQSLSLAIQNAGGDIANARGIAARDDERLLFTDKRCYSQRPSSGTWSDAGEVAATSATTLPIARTGTYQTQPDIAERNGVRVIAWEDSRGGVWCSVLESTTGRVLLSQRQLDSSVNAKDPRCLAVGEVIHVLWTRVDLGQIQLALVNPATPSLAPVTQILTSDLSITNPVYDAEAAPAAPSGISTRPGVIAWAVPGGGIRIGYIAPDGTLGSPLSGLPSVIDLSSTVQVTSVAISYCAANSTIAVGIFRAQTVLRVFFFDSLLTLVISQFNPVLSGSNHTKLTLAWGGFLPSGAIGCWYISEITSTRTDLCSLESGYVAYVPDVILGHINEMNTPSILLGHSLVSRAFHDGGPPEATATESSQGGDVYAFIAHTVTFFPYVAALRLSDDSGIATPGNTIVSRLMPGECSGALMRTTGAGTRAWTQHLPSVMAIGIADTDVYSRTHAVCVPYRIQLSSENGDQFSEQGLKLAELNFLPAYQSAQLGRGLYLASSAPMHYDGDAWHEADFHTAPDLGFDTGGVPVLLSTSATPIGTGNIPDGTYLCAYWYEAVDAQGELHRGPVSVRFLVEVTGGPRQIRHTLPTCKLTRFANVRICVARSIQGAEGTESTIPLFRVTSNDVTVTTGANRYVLNDPTLNTVTFDDSLSDDDLILREPCYTNGGILSNAPSPWSGAVLAQGKGRLFWTDTTNPNLVRFSQENVDDVALEAPIELAVSVDPFGGPITAIGVMDDGVYPFKESAVYAFGGPGPLADPSVVTNNNGFTTADLVTSDVGCRSARSVGQTPEGLIFQSNKGIYLLNRGRQALYVGEPVDPLNTQVIERCTLMPDRQQILCLTSTPGGFSLLWDYSRNQWSKFSNHVGLDAVVVDGVYHYLRPDSRVFQETPGVYRDDNTQIQMTIETAWIRFQPYLQGWQKILRAYFLGKFLSPHTLILRYRLDYNETYSHEISLDVDTNWNPSLFGAGPYGAGPWGGADGGTRYQRWVHLNRRCQAISFRIQDLEDADDFGASFELSELLLLGGGVGKAFKPGAARGGQP